MVELPFPWKESGRADAVERAVTAVVYDKLGTRIEEEREKDPGQNDHDEAVESDLAQHERPVVRERLVERAASESRRTEPVVDPSGNPARDHDRAEAGRAGVVCSKLDNQAAKSATAAIR